METSHRAISLSCAAALATRRRRTKAPGENIEMLRTGSSPPDNERRCTACDSLKQCSSYCERARRNVERDTALNTERGESLRFDTGDAGRRHIEDAVV